jgi:hypothetical protein
MEIVSREMHGEKRKKRGEREKKERMNWSRKNKRKMG